MARQHQVRLQTAIDEGTRAAAAAATAATAEAAGLAIGAFDSSMITLSSLSPSAIADLAKSDHCRTLRVAMTEPGYAPQPAEWENMAFPIGENGALTKTAKGFAVGMITVTKSQRTRESVLHPEDAPGGNNRIFEDAALRMQQVCTLLCTRVLKEGIYCVGDRRIRGFVALSDGAEAAKICRTVTWEAFTVKAYVFSSWHYVVDKEFSIDGMAVEELVDCMRGYCECMIAVWGERLMGTRLAYNMVSWIAEYHRLDQGCLTYPSAVKGIMNDIVSPAASKALKQTLDMFRGSKDLYPTLAASVSRSVLDQTPGFCATLRNYDMAVSALAQARDQGIPKPKTRHELLFFMFGGIPAQIAGTFGPGGKDRSAYGTTKTCHNCGRVGHLKADCTAKPNQDGGGKKGGGGKSKKSKTDAREGFTDALKACQVHFSAAATKCGKVKACMFASCCEKGCNCDTDKCTVQSNGRQISHAKADQLTKAQAHEYLLSSLEVVSRVQEGPMRAKHDKFGLQQLADKQP